MKIGLLGCGAMGSLYGGYLSKAHEVYVCDVWKEHIEAIKANGIRLDEPEGETAVFTPKFATTDPSEIGPVDIMIVFVKYMMLEDALRNAKSMIGENTIVLSLQNGIGNYDEIAKVVPEEQICCGTTAHGCTFLEPGHVRHTGRGVTNVGTRPTVNNGLDVTVEAWLLDFDGDLYGQTVRVEFLQHLRDEVRFDSLDALRSQILKDAEKTRQILAQEQAG